jgi:hypothetical protein
MSGEDIELNVVKDIRIDEDKVENMKTNKKKKCPECNKVLTNDNYCNSCGFLIGEKEENCGICGEIPNNAWIEVDKNNKEYVFYEICKDCGKVICDSCSNGILDFGHMCDECFRKYYQSIVCPECEDRECRLCKWSNNYNPTREELDYIEGQEAFYNLTHDENGNIECGWEYLFED